MTDPNSFPLLIIIGPSASGKSSVVQRLHRQGVIRVYPTWTTRPPRSGEQQKSVEHVFVGPEEFDELSRQQFFIDTVQMFGLEHRYGLPRITPDGPGQPTIMLRAQLLPRVKQHFSHYRVYHIEDTFEQVEQRLAKRLAEGEQVGSRLSDFQREVELGHQLADRVFTNTGIDSLAASLAAAISEDFGC